MIKYLLTKLIILSAFISLNSFAQWSADPNNPLAVCTAAGNQTGVRAIQDGSGGYYAFWLDARSGSNQVEIYGQRYNASGIALWQIDGKQIFGDTTEDITAFSVIRNFQGNLFVAFTQSSDSSYIIKTDPDGIQLWPEPLLIAGRGSSSVLYTGSLSMVEKDTGVFVCVSVTYFGGAASIHMNRVSNNGILMMGYNGVAVPNAGYGGFGLTPDGAGGLYIYWRNSNGAGTGLGVRRMTANCTFLWTGNVNPAAGTPGLGYDYSAVYDNNYGLILCWIESGGNVMMSRVDTSGALTWNPGVLPACIHTSSQDRCRIVMNGNFFFISWQDNRPPANNADTYIQKFNLNGQPQWTMDGVKCSGVSSYIPYTKMVASVSGSVIYSYDGTGSTNGLYTQRIKADSTLAWSGNGARLSNNTFAPFYDDYILLASTDSGAVVFWSTGANIYAAKAGYNGPLVGVNEINHELNFSLFPNPAEDQFVLQSSNLKINDKIVVFDSMGKTIIESVVADHTDQLILSSKYFSAGIYFVQLQSEMYSFTRKLVINK